MSRAFVIRQTPKGKRLIPTQLSDLAEELEAGHIRKVSTGMYEEVDAVAVPESVAAVEEVPAAAGEYQTADLQPARKRGRPRKNAQ